MSAFDALAAIPPQNLRDGILARAVHGERITFAVVEIEPNAELPEHIHANEQLGIVLHGSVTFRVGEETHNVQPGGIWRVPPNAPHFLQAGPEGAIVLDMFTPVRDDWKRLGELAPRKPQWP